jgi:molybdopterin-guanine dinucleotide biosynthesis protein A
MPSEMPSARPGSDTPPRWDAVIVAGGRASRLGGIDKTALIWHGRTLLNGVLSAAAGAGRICVVGSTAELPATVLRTVERPRWGGPAAAIEAGLAALAADTTAEDADWVVVLAGDLLHADEAVPALLAELGENPAAASTNATAGQPRDGVISVDSAGRRQPLLAVYRREALVSAAGLLGSAENLAVTRLIGDLELTQVRLPDALSADVDTPADAARLGIGLPGAASPTTPAAPTTGWAPTAPPAPSAPTGTPSRPQ